MKIKFIALWLLFVPFMLSKAQEPEPIIKSEIKKVIVYKQGAQIIREVEQLVKKGTQTLIFGGLPDNLNPDNFQLKVAGNVAVLSVSHFNSNERKQKSDTETKAIELQISDLNTKVSRNHALQKVFTQEQSLLYENKNISATENGISVSELAAITKVYRERLNEISGKLFDLKQELSILNKKIDELNIQLADLKLKHAKSETQTEVILDAETAGIVKFNLSYIVPDAGWNPVYDIKVKDIQTPAEFVYNAQVYQLTGEDWNNVQIVLSTASPENSTFKSLEPWLLGFYTYQPKQITESKLTAPKTIRGYVRSADDNLAVPGATVTVKGFSGIGTISDFNGFYSLQVPAGAYALVYSFVGMKQKEQSIYSDYMEVTLEYESLGLSEVVVTGYSGKKGLLSGRGKRKMKDKKESEVEEFEVDEEQGEEAYFAISEQEAPKYYVPTTRTTNTTTTEYVIEKPYSLVANGKKNNITIMSRNVPANYVYTCIPKYDKSAWLVAQIVNWEQYELLSADANLYFEGSFVGTSRIDLDEVSDTLKISLGKDESISLAYTQGKEASTKNLVNARRKTFDWNIEVRNKKNLPIQLIIEDQIPISKADNITVELMNQGGAEFNKETGKLTWKLDIPKTESRKLNFVFSVKYPKSLNLK